MKPDLVLQIGDLYDNFNFSRFYKSPDIIQPRRELETANRCAETMWASIVKVSPRSKCIQMAGNHDKERLDKMVLTAAPALAALIEDRAYDLFTFPKVESLYDYKDTLVQKVSGERVTFCHGFLSTTIGHVDHFNTSVVCGHLHRSSCDWVVRGGRPLFGLNVGYVGNHLAPVFNYTRSHSKNWTVGLGVIDRHGPRFIPDWRL